MKLKTPLGVIELLLDNKPVSFLQRSIERNAELFPDVEAAYRLVYEFKSDKKEHKLIFRLQGCNAEAYPESGELLELISFYQNGCKLTLGCTASFGDHEDYGLDYDGSICKNGIEINILPTTKSRNFKFGVCWINNCNDENDTQTWFGVDPSIDE